MSKRLRVELPGKVLPPLPRKNRKHSLYPGKDDDDADSISSVSTQGSTIPGSPGLRGYLPFGGGSHRRSSSRASNNGSPRNSIDANRSPIPRSPALTPSLRPKSLTLASPNLAVPGMSPGGGEPQMLYREEQRVSLRAFIRGYLNNPMIAQTQAIRDFLTTGPIELNEEEREDVARRQEMDEKRIEEQRRFFEIAQQRARDLDVHMEKFRREIVESSTCICSSLSGHGTNI